MKFVILVSVLLLVLVSLLCIYIILYFIKRENKLLNRIQRMLDDAIDGSFQDRYLDESKISLIENSMWRFLCDHQAAHQKLLEDKEQIQSLVSDISHQTVTPIANIVLYAQLLEEWQHSKEGSPDLEIMDEITAIREQAQKLDFLVECLVKLSRLENGIINVKPRKQNIEPVLLAVQKQFMAKAGEKGICLTVESTGEMAVFDLKWTIEALANVVDNAIKYTPGKGAVTIGVEAYSFFACINVTDQGMGIPEAEQANIFTRFYRCGEVSEKPGLGIGLYLAREVMKTQNGYIKLSSRVGKGSKFSLFLLKEEMSQR